MNIRLFCAIVLLQLASARHAFSPKFFGQDSVVIVDANRPVQATSKQKHHSLQRNRPSHHYRPVHYPVYHIIPQIQPAVSTPIDAHEAITSPTSTTTTTPPTIFTKEEFPSDLLDIAQEKLGIKSIDEIPTISELGELLGTENAEETIKYIRDLTATEEGIEFVKAYIESTDYTDNTGSGTSTTTPTVVKSTDAEEMIEDPPKPSIFERLSTYLNVFDLFSSPTITDTKEDADLQHMDRITTQGRPLKVTSVKKNFNENNIHKPILVRNPLPYHYPIPVRPLVVYHPRAGTPHNPMHSVVHLNTPKIIVPQMYEASASKPSNSVTSKAIKQPQQKQQLNDLAARVSKFPLAHNRDALVDAQYASAVEKAFAGDEDLKNIMGSTETLK